MPNSEIHSKAILLKKTAFRENDLLLDLFVKKEGAIRAIAFGAGSCYSSRGRHCQSFQEFSVYLKKQLDANTQKSSYQVLEIAQLGTTNLLLLSVGQAIDLTKDSQHMLLGCAHYVNACYLHLANQFEQHKQAYNLYIDTLKSLQQAANPIMINCVLRYFEMQMLGFLGYDIRHIGEQVEYGSIDNQSYFSYDLHDGWQVCADQNSSLSWSSCLNLDCLEKLDLTQLKRLKQHNQKLLNELSNFKIQPNREWLKSIYSKISNAPSS